MSSTPQPHGDDAVREKPSQGVFIGWLAFGLFIFAVLWACFGLLAAVLHFK